MTTFQIDVFDELLGQFRDMAERLGWTVEHSEQLAAAERWRLTIAAEGDDVPEWIEGKLVDPVFVHAWRDDSLRVSSWGVTT